MLDYDYINQIFKSELDKDSIKKLLSFANELSFFYDRILKSCQSLPQTNYKHTIVNSFHYAINYIKTSHPRYYSELSRMFADGEIHVASFESDNAECSSYTGEIWIGLNRTILDDLNLVHEFFHHQNLIPINKGGVRNNITRELFGESISIAAQLDFSKKIKDDDLKEDSKKFEIDYINDAITCTKRIRTELILIEIYNKNGRITEDLIKEFILNNRDNDLGMLVLAEYENVLNSISGWGADFKFGFHLKYLLGITIGYYLADLVEQDFKNWKMIYDINAKMYDLSVDEFLDKIGISLKDEKLISRLIDHFQSLKEMQKQKK